MYRILYTPSKYLQGNGALATIGEFLKKRSRHCFALLDPGIEAMLRERLTQAFDPASCPGAPALSMAVASGECCEEEVERLTREAKNAGADTILAAGGGKTVDIGKAVGARCKIPSIIVPTIAASDAPTSSISIMYSSDHVYKGAVRFDDNPYMILVDTEIISNAPPRFLAAGMGDALATKIEAERCMQAGGANLHGFTGTLSALYMARCAYDLILEKGESAMQAVRDKRVTEDLEDVVEANILMSGLGWENCGLTIPHAFHGALTPISIFDAAMHGERVALGVLLQLHYDGEAEELERLTRFFKAVGLPTRFADIASGPVSQDDLDQATALITRPGSYAHNLPGGLDAEKLAASLKAFN